MPVEIRELQITAIVQDSTVQKPQQASVSTSANENIVAACVEQVLEILKQKTER